MKALTFSLDGNEKVCSIGAAIKKQDLYGRSQKIAVAADDTPLQSGLLTQDGKLLERDEVSLLLVDEQGSFIGKPHYLRDGETVTPQPSSFKETRELEPEDWSALQRFAVQTVYPLTPCADLMPGLYRSTFNYMSSVDPNPCLLLVKADAPSFILVGQWVDFMTVGKAITYNLFDADSETEEEDESDFNFDDMF